MAELNAMEELARAAYYIQDTLRGVPGVFEVEEDGWGQGDFSRALVELKDCQGQLREAGFERVKYLEEEAPYTSNIEVAVYKKGFDKKTLWITITCATRFGLSATFTCTHKKPW